MKCPHCKKSLKSHFVALGKKGGKAKGASKARTSEQASAAAKARWVKKKANATAQTPPDSGTKNHG
jgi:hypothetical protein